MEAAAHPWPTLGVLMLRDGLVTKEQLEAILDEQRDSRQQRMSGHRLGEILIDRGLVTPMDVARLVAEQYELPFTELDSADIDLRIARRFSEELARRLSAIPVNMRPNGTYVLAIADPATVLFSDELRLVLGSALQFVVVGPDAMEAAIAFVYDRAEAPPEAPEPGYSEGTVLELRQEESAPYDTTPAHTSPMTHQSPPLGALLVREGLVSEDELDAALAQQRLSTSWRLGEILVNRGVVTPAGIARVIAEQYELPFVDLANAYVDPAVVSRLPREVARNFPAVPIAECSDGSLQVAIADPTNVYYSDELRGALGTALTFVVAAPDAIEAVIESAYETVNEPENIALHGAADMAVTPLELDDELPVTAEVDEIGSGPDDDLPELGPDSAVVDEVVAKPDELTARLEVVEDAPAEPVSIESDGTDVVEEHVVAEVAAAPTETEVGEPVLGWLPTWTTEIQLVDYEPTVDDERETTQAEADDLSAALLAEIAQGGDSVGTQEEDEYPAETYERVAEHESDDESAPAAPVIALVEYVETEDVAEDEPAGSSVPPSVVDEAVELDAAVSSPAVELVDVAVEEVLRLGATAVHFSPSGREYVVRARVDGSMRDLGVVSNDDLEPIVERFESSVRMRVHVMPTAKGDKVTLFPLDETAPTEFFELGLTGDSGAVVREALARPSGAFVACGPVGSGTTTTLYAALAALNTPERVLATIEDPIARVLEGVDQMEVDVARGVSFAGGLRMLLATDSDVVLVGEIGDRETAEAVFAGALAGRHVLSALRAPGAAAAIRRLLDLGLEPSRICDAPTCVVAQRLVRRVCLDCRETYYATESELAELGQSPEESGPRLLARGRGCESCAGTGFRGRVGIFEALRMTDEIRALVVDDASAKKLQRAAVAGGMRTLREDGIRLCLEGITTSTELQRVLGADR